MKCPNCGVPLMAGMNVCPKCKYDSSKPGGGESFRAYVKKKEEDAEQKRQEEAREKFISENRNELRNNMILTSCPSIEGYKVEQHLGLVFGELIFKAGSNTLSDVGMINFLDSFSYKDKELKGPDLVISRAREYSVLKLKDAAIDKGANAVIGIDYRSSFAGDGIVHIVICGTAVVVSKV